MKHMSSKNLNLFLPFSLFVSFKFLYFSSFFSQIICSPLFREKRGARIPTYRPTAPPPFLVGPLSPCLPLITSHKPFLLYRYVIMSSFLFHFFSFYMFNFATFAAVASCGLQTDWSELGKWNLRFRMVNINIKAWLSLFIETSLILYVYPENCIKFIQSEWAVAYQKPGNLKFCASFKIYLYRNERGPS